MSAAPEAREVPERSVRDDHDISAATAVAAIGPAFRYMRLAPEGDHAVAAVSTSHVDARAVVEHS